MLKLCPIWHLPQAKYRAVSVGRAGMEAFCIPWILGIHQCHEGVGVRKLSKWSKSSVPGCSGPSLSTSLSSTLCILVLSNSDCVIWFFPLTITLVYQWLGSLGTESQEIMIQMAGFNECDHLGGIELSYWETSCPFVRACWWLTKVQPQWTEH